MFKKGRVGGKTVQTIFVAHVSWGHRSPWRILPNSKLLASLALGRLNSELSWSDIGWPYFYQLSWKPGPSCAHDKYSTKVASMLICQELCCHASFGSTQLFYSGGLWRPEQRLAPSSPICFKTMLWRIILSNRNLLVNRRLFWSFGVTSFNTRAWWIFFLNHLHRTGLSE